MDSSGSDLDSPLEEAGRGCGVETRPVVAWKIKSTAFQFEVDPKSHFLRRKLDSKKVTASIKYCIIFFEESLLGVRNKSCNVIWCQIEANANRKSKRNIS